VFPQPMLIIMRTEGYNQSRFRTNFHWSARVEAVCINA
jgi:hypothetical protein